MLAQNSSQFLDKRVRKPKNKLTRRSEVLGKPSNPYRCDPKTSVSQLDSKTPRKRPRMAKSYNHRMRPSHRGTKPNHSDVNLLKTNGEDDQWEAIVKFEAAEAERLKEAKKADERKQKESIRKELENQIRIHREAKEKEKK